MRYGTLRRRANPGIGETPIHGIFINPLRPSKTRRKKKKNKKKTAGRKSTNPKQKGAPEMARKKRTSRRRDSKGRFLKRATNPRRKTRKRLKNPTQYPVRANPTATRKPRRLNPVSYSGSPGRYVQAPNPRRRRKGMYKYNPNGSAMTLERMIPPALAGIGGFLAPGLAWELIGQKGRSSVAGWFKGSQNADAWGRFTVGSITTGALYFLSRKVDFLKKHQLPMMIGSLLKNGHDLADAVLSSTPGTMGARLRRILSLPTAAQMQQPGAPGTQTGAQQAGYVQDPTTGQWIYAGGNGAPANGMNAGTYPGADALDMLAGEGATQGMIGAPGMGESHPLDPGMGEIYVKRGLVKANTPKGMGEIYVKRELVDVTGRYTGIGATFVEKGLAYLEPGQRFPAQTRIGAY